MDWEKNFGFFPRNLKSGKFENFSVLKGAQNLINIISSEENNSDYYNSISWSSNTKASLLIKEDKSYIFNWTASKPEIISTKSLSNQIEAFIQYLYKINYTSEEDVINYFLSKFLSLRNFTQEKNNPIQALQLFYLLLLSLNEENPNGKFLYYWNLDQININSSVEKMIFDVREGFNNIKFDLDLILRYCAGPIFQETHKNVIWFDNNNLFGYPGSNQIKFTPEYSSVHFTPGYIVRMIVKECLNKRILERENLAIFDPTCGTSEFLLETLRQLDEKNYKGSIKVIAWDRLESAISISKFLLNYQKRTYWGNKLTIEIKLINDSLTEAWPSEVDLLLMNPPYKAWELLTIEEKEVVNSIIIEKIKKPNLAASFFSKALNTLKDGSILGCVLPSSLFDLDKYYKLFNKVNDQITINFVAKLGSFIFEKAFTDVSLLIAEKCYNSCETEILWCKNQKGVSDIALTEYAKARFNGINSILEPNFSIYQQKGYPINGIWKIRSFQDEKLKIEIEKKIHSGLYMRINELFTIEQGIRTGNNKSFKFSLDYISNLPEKEKKYYKPCIDNEAFEDGKIYEKYYLWYPYKDHKLLFNSEEDLKKNAPISYSYLIEHKEKLINRRSITSPEKWWALSRPRINLNRKRKRLISKEFGSNDFVIVTMGEYLVERGYVWSLIENNSNINDYYFFLAFFSSEYFVKLLSIYAKQLASSNTPIYDFKPTQLGLIPIPNIFNGGIRNSIEYSKLCEIGKSICEEGVYVYRYLFSDTINSLIKL